MGPKSACQIRQATLTIKELVHKLQIQQIVKEKVNFSPGIPFLAKTTNVINKNTVSSGNNGTNVLRQCNLLIMVMLTS